MSTAREDLQGCGSYGGAVTIRSATHRATAWYNGQQDAAHAVINANARRTFPHLPFMPITVRLLIAFASAISGAAWVMLILCVAVFSGLGLPALWERGVHVLDLLDTPSTFPFLWIATMLLMRWYVEPWRMAEQMTVAAYRETGDVRMEDILRQSPVTLGWGEMTLLFLIPAWYIGSWAQLHLGLNPWIVRLIALEAMLQFEARIGLRSLPFVGKHISQLLQHMAVKPRDCHLKTAQTAVTTLISTH